MACRLPGGIDAPARLWEALLRGRDFVTEIPPERWNADDYYDPEPGVSGRSVSKWGAFLDDVAGFDADFFGISEREAIAVDPQHRILLETAWEAVEHAGVDPASLAGSRTGVFVGLTHGDYQFVVADAQAIDGPYGFTGCNFSLASGRIAYALGLHGPAFTVDSACSSSLLAVHQACGSLHEGESDIVLAGGASITLDPRKLASGSAQGMLSPTGRCHAFDAAADGFVSGEAAVLFLMKRLPDAQRDGDPILAVVRGTSTNQDGHTVNIATPSRDAQVAAYRTALAAGDVDPDTVGMVEAHGTGTPVGDQIEYASLAQVYGSDRRCALGSAKTNFGHSQSASGATGMMKAILALQHATIPPNLHFTRLPDDMAGIETQLFVPQVTTPWPGDTGDTGDPRRAAVSSYGLSGTNVHVILEQAPGSAAPLDAVTDPADAERFALLISASSADALRRTAGRIADWITRHADDSASRTALPDLAYTLARRRAHRPVRTAVLAGSLDEAVNGLREVADSDAPYQEAVARDDRGPVWVFSGQGSQWAGMGADLLAREPAFAAAVAELEPLIARESGFSVTEAMSAPDVVTGIDRVQPTVFAVQLALAAAMRSYGVFPGAIVGHSMGEVAAAVVAGALTLEDGVRVICRRSRLMAGISGSGAMASVELPASQVLSELAAHGLSDVVLSVVASPQSTVVGGAKEAVRTLVSEWEQRGVMAREVAVEVASHTPEVDSILDDLTEALADLRPAEPTIPYYSATLYDPRDPADFDADYWADNLRHTVRFAAAAQAAMEDGYRVFGELSPHPLLTHAVDQTARALDVPLTALASVRREVEMPDGLLGFLADLHTAGAAVDFAALYPDGRLVDVPLPSWTHIPLTLTRDDQERPVGGVTVAVHPLLGAHVRLPEEPEHHVWQADLGTAAHPWLGDCRVDDVAVLPAAAYCEMALAAAHSVLGDSGEVHDASFEHMLRLEDHTVVSASTSAAGPGCAEFLVETYRDGERTRHAAAVLHAATAGGAADDAAPGYDIEALLAAHPHRVDGAALRKFFDECGIHHGPAFEGLAAVFTGDEPVSTVLGNVTLPGTLRSQRVGYGVHPALLDACFQTVAAHPAVAGTLLLPLGVHRMRSYGPTRNAHYCYTRVTGVDAAEVQADVDVLDGNGTVLLTVSGLRLGTGVSGSGQQDQMLNDRLLTIDWQQRPAPEAGHAATGAWLVVGMSDAGPLSVGEVADALKQNHVDVTTMLWAAHGDHADTVDRLRGELAATAFTGVVVVTAPSNGASADKSPARGRDSVGQLVRIANVLAEHPGPRFFVVTRKAQSVAPGDVPNLEQGGLRGLVRVIAMEHPVLRPVQIDVDDDTQAATVAAQVLSGSAEDETAWRDGRWYTARLRLSPLGPDERRTAVVNHDRDGTRLQIRTPGDLQSLEFTAFDRVPPGPGQIEVAVATARLNFADVLIADGRYPSFERRLPQLGADFAGVVTAVGPGVMGHRIGDRVAGIAADGAWGTFVSCDANLAVTLPDGLPLDRAAAVPTAHITAWYGLHQLARISSRDKVLIHSATGGVGQAAIAMARAAGAEVFATAGSHERRELLRAMGIKHVYDSRSTEFAELIRRDTDGYGVDVVLNSLPGPAQRAGLELLSFGGRFVEIGKQGIYGDTRMGLFPFRRNLAFYAVDLALLTLTDPGMVGGLLEVVYRQIADGVVPPPEVTHYPLAEAGTAIQAMSAAQHTGKLVLNVPDGGQSVAVVPPRDAPVFCGDGSYVITGGLGGLGLFLAEKMAAAGCGRIVLNGRSAPSPTARGVIGRLRRMGTEIEVACGDIAEPATADRVVSAATATGLPMRGVLHAAAVVEDAMLANVTDHLIDRDWAPKAYGAWHLHQATIGQPLDWFCSFSSAAALVGSPGQGAYAAANSWLDGFTHWRRAQGLPANAIAWGAWAQIGQGQAMAADTAMAIAPEDGAYAFDTLLRHDRPYTAYAPVAGAPWLTAFASVSPFAEAFKELGQHSDASRFLSELRELPEKEWPGRIRKLIADPISLILRRSIDPDRPLSEYGLDSLGNLEVRTLIEAKTGMRVNPRDITTVRTLAEKLSAALAAEQGVPLGGSRAT